MDAANQRLHIVGRPELRESKTKVVDFLSIAAVFREPFEQRANTRQARTCRANLAGRVHATWIRLAVLFITFFGGGDDFGLFIRRDHFVVAEFVSKRALAAGHAG